jgi:hypothetical protein
VQVQIVQELPQARKADPFRIFPSLQVIAHLLEDSGQIGTNDYLLDNPTHTELSSKCLQGKAQKYRCKTSVEDWCGVTRLEYRALTDTTQAGDASKWLIVVSGHMGKC